MSFGSPNSSNNGIALQLANDGSGRFYLNRYNDAYYSTATVDDGAWHFAAATYDGTTLKLYIDGVLQGSGVAVTMALDQTYSSGGMIGDMGTYGYAWNGSLSDGRIYNRALSLLEVQTIYAGDMGAVATYDKSTSSAAQNLGSRLATTPTIAAGAGAGSSPTIAVAGSDSSFQITLTTGSAPTGSNATIATVTFASTMPNTAHCVLTPANANAAALTGATQVFASTTTAALTLTSGATALSATTAYVWNVHTF
jgi:hypothetical protein